MGKNETASQDNAAWGNSFSNGTRIVICLISVSVARHIKTLTLPLSADATGHEGEWLLVLPP